MVRAVGPVERGYEEIVWWGLWQDQEVYEEMLLWFVRWGLWQEVARKCFYGSCSGACGKRVRGNIVVGPVARGYEDMLLCSCSCSCTRRRD